MVGFMVSLAPVVLIMVEEASAAEMEATGFIRAQASQKLATLAAQLQKMARESYGQGVSFQIQLSNLQTDVYLTLAETGQAECWEKTLAAWKRVVKLEQAVGELEASIKK